MSVRIPKRKQIAGSDIDEALTLAVSAWEKVDTERLVAGSIINSKIADEAITADKIEAGTITATEISAGSITTTQLSFTPYVVGANNLDDIEDGTNYSKVLTTDISAGHILLTETIGDLDDITDGTDYAKVLKTSISSGLILLSQTTGDLDDIGDGSTYGKVRQTILGSGYIQIGSGTKDVSLNGFHFNESEIVGQAAGVDQVVMDTTGAIKAGAGSVILDENGVTITGQLLTFKRGNDIRGYVFASTTTDKMNLYGVGADIYLSPGIGKKTICASDVSMNTTHKIVDLATPTADSDAATKKYVDDNSGINTASIYSPFTEGTGSGQSTAYGGILCANGEQAVTSIQVPPDFNFLISAKLIVKADATQANANWDVYVLFANNGESYITHTASDTASTYNVTNNYIKFVSITSLLSGITAEDIIGVRFKVSSAGHDAIAIGVVLNYSK